MCLNLPAFAFERQNKKYFTVNMLLACILYCDSGPVFLSELFALKYRYVDSYHGYHICHSMS